MNIVYNDEPYICIYNLNAKTSKILSIPKILIEFRILSLSPVEYMILALVSHTRDYSTLMYIYNEIAPYRQHHHHHKII